MPYPRDSATGRCASAHDRRPTRRAGNQLPTPFDKLSERAAPTAHILGQGFARQPAKPCAWSAITGALAPFFLQLVVAWPSTNPTW